MSIAICEIFEVPEELLKIIVNLTEYRAQVSLRRTCKKLLQICDDCIPKDIIIEECCQTGYYVAMMKFIRDDLKYVRSIHHVLLLNSSLCGNVIFVKYLKTLEICNWDDCLRYGSNGGHLDIVNLAIENGATKYNDALEQACLMGHLNIVKLLMEKGANYWNGGLWYACQGGNIDIVNLMIENKPDKWELGLYGACQGGHINIINMMIEKGVTISNLVFGFCYACRGGNMNIINLMMEKISAQGIDIVPWCSRALYITCSDGHINIVKFLFEIIGTKFHEWSEALNRACENGNINLINLLIEKYSGEGTMNWNSGLYGACYGGHMNIVTMMIDKWNETHEPNSEGLMIDYNGGIRNACRGGRMNIVKFLAEKIIARGSWYDWNSSMYEACKIGRFDIVEFLIRKGANNFNLGLMYATQHGHLRIVQLMLTHGATDLATAHKSAIDYGYPIVAKFLKDKIEQIK